MTPARKPSGWLRELEDLYERVLALPDEAAQLRFVDQACESRPELGAELRRMLSASGKSFLDHPVTASLSLGPPGQDIGRWRLLEMVGEGGMGVVYRGETLQDGVTLEAAVKILRPGFDTGLLRQRFLHERQILAGLDHPGIARFIDCGAGSDGRSFLAVEYVRGEPVEDYLAAHPGLHERIRIFEEVALAVEYLHGRLVVHGDLKPANIRMSATGVPKLLDFGAARLLASGAEAGELTRMMLTPEYASPEQKRGEGPSVAGDIYSLGRLLQDLLAPSPDSATDLRLIAARCMAEDPAGRYSSVTALIEDLRRWREGFPVRARGATVWYRFRRFARRQWPIVLLLGLLVGSVLVGWVVAMRGERRAKELAVEAQRQAALARESAETARRNATEAQRQQLRADEEALAAKATAERLRSLVQQLVDSHEISTAAAMGNNQQIVEKALSQAISEMERMPDGPQRLPGLVILWRRLAQNLAFQGKFKAAFPAADRGLALSRELWRRQPTAANHARYVAALFDVPRIHMLRGDIPSGSEAGQQAMDELAKLPPEQRAAFEDTEPMLLQRLSRAERAGDRAEVARILETAERRLFVRVKQMGLRFSILESIRVKDRAKTRELCQEAADQGIVAPPLRALCPPPPGGRWALSDSQRVRLETEAVAGRMALERQPDSFEARIALITSLGRLALHHAQLGNLASARQMRDQLAPHLTAVQAVDPEGATTRRLVANMGALDRMLTGSR